MAEHKFPTLDAAAITNTRDALHDYARVAGAWASGSRKRRKHWWHASLRPSLRGLTTGVVYGRADFELELDFARSRFHVRTDVTTVSKHLTGQASREVAEIVRHTLIPLGIDQSRAPGEGVLSDTTYPDYSAGAAYHMFCALASLVAVFEDLRAGIREETSPIQVWPHHFDLSMIWLPGPKVAGQDPADEEHADKQMNFGFAFGDETIPEPYIYVTAYPLPDALPQITLPAGASWRSEGFNGVVLPYRELTAMADPHAYLLELWELLLDAGRKHLAVDG